MKTQLPGSCYFNETYIAYYISKSLKQSKKVADFRLSLDSYNTFGFLYWIFRFLLISFLVSVSENNGLMHDWFILDSNTIHVLFSPSGGCYGNYFYLKLNLWTKYLESYFNCQYSQNDLRLNIFKPLYLPQSSI